MKLFNYFSIGLLALFLSFQLDCSDLRKFVSVKEAAEKTKKEVVSPLEMDIFNRLYANYQEDFGGKQSPVMFAITFGSRDKFDAIRPALALEPNIDLDKKAFVSGMYSDSPRSLARTLSKSFNAPWLIESLEKYEGKVRAPSPEAELSNLERFNRMVGNTSPYRYTPTTSNSGTSTPRPRSRSIDTPSPYTTPSPFER